MKVHNLLCMDIAVSAGTGAVLAIGIIVFLSFFPGEPFQYKVDSETQGAVESTTGEENLKTDPAELQRQEERVSKSKKLQKLLGLNDVELKKALTSSRNSRSEDDSTDNDTSSLSFCRVVELFLYIALVLLLFFIVNVFTQGDFGRVLVGIFPVEFERLGLVEYLTVVSGASAGDTTSYEAPGAQLDSMMASCDSQTADAICNTGNIN